MTILYGIVMFPAHCLVFFCYENFLLSFFEKIMLTKLLVYNRRIQTINFIKFLKKTWF